MFEPLKRTNFTVILGNRTTLVVLYVFDDKIKALIQKSHLFASWTILIALHVFDALKLKRT